MDRDEFENLTLHKVADDVDALIEELRIGPLVDAGMGPTIRVWMSLAWMAGARFGFEHGVNFASDGWQSALRRVLDKLKERE